MAGCKCDYHKRSTNATVLHGLEKHTRIHKHPKLSPPIRPNIDSEVSVFPHGSYKISRFGKLLQTTSIFQVLSFVCEQQVVRLGLESTPKTCLENQYRFLSLVKLFLVCLCTFLTQKNKKQNKDNFEESIQIFESSIQL